jgi:RNA polymerase sigma-70 factor (ECF subfamily)
VALEALMSEGKLPSRREHDNQDRTALQSIMNEVDDLSRDRLPAPDAVADDEDDGEEL